MTRDQIVETLTQWVYENLPATVAPRIVIVEDHGLELGNIEILIRAGCGIPSGCKPAELGTGAKELKP